jgi:cell division initiation protein
MRITPLEIRKHPFRKTFFGLDPDQVNSFLGMVAEEFEAIISHNNEMMTNHKHLEEKLETYTKIEKTLNETLVTAQKATDEARHNSQKEAELIIKDAQIRAGRYEDDSKRRVHELESELVALKNQRDSFLARFRSMLKTQLDLLGVISEDLKGTQHDTEAAVMEELEHVSEAPPEPEPSDSSLSGL